MLALSRCRMIVSPTTLVALAPSSTTTTSSPPAQPKPPPQWQVYAIYSQSKTRSYVGATTNSTRRLRQHNAEIKGGAKYTRCAHDWQYLFKVSGFVHTRALQFEWALKHTTKKRKRGFVRAKGKYINGRIANLERVLHLDKWKELPLVVTWVQQDKPITFDSPKGITHMFI